jgi:tol-pal system protein YbgF
MAERVATLSSQVLSLEGQIQAQQERLDQTARPGAAAATLPAPGPATAPARPTDPPPPAAGEGPDQVYRAALTEFTRKNYEQAGRGFQAFLAAFPQDSRSADAQYWYAESLRGQGNYAQAAQEFEAFVKRAPENSKVPTAQVRYGESLLLNGDKAAGCPVLQGVRRQYGRTRAGALAQDLMVQYCS